MEWPDASNFACLISGYYKLFVDPKRTIYYRAPGQSHMIKAGMVVRTSLVSKENKANLYSMLLIYILIKKKHLCCCQSSRELPKKHLYY